jgi:hypothetical protein
MPSSGTVEQLAEDYFRWRMSDDVRVMEGLIRRQAEEIATLKSENARLRYRLHRNGGIMVKEG